MGAYLMGDLIFIAVEVAAFLLTALITFWIAIADYS